MLNKYYYIEVQNIKHLKFLYKSLDTLHGYKGDNILLIKHVWGKGIKEDTQ